jgi:hypothetical protein
VQSLDDDNLVLLCDRMRNWSVTTCDSKGNCHTNYYCDKCNVTAFKLSKDGTLLWASNLDRRITYNGWNIYDLKSMHTSDKIYTTYGSAYVAGAKKKNRASRKSRGYMTDRFEYAVFDYASGNFSKKEYKVNPINAKKGDKKFMDPTKISVIDNELFANSIKVKPKLVPMLIGCGMGIGGTVMSILGMTAKPSSNPVLFFAGGCVSVTGSMVFSLSFVIGDWKSGSGYLGKIEPIK